MDRTPLRRGLGMAVLLAAASAGPAPACQEVLTYLSGRKAFRSGFGLAVYQMVELLGQVYTPEGAPLPAGQEKLAAALEGWMNLYMRYYTSPPVEVSRYTPEWKARMDSVAAPLGRVRAYHKSGKHDDGHRQLQILQRILGSFGGLAPVFEPGGIGPLRHTVASLAEIHADDQDARRERNARWKVLAEYFGRWKEACAATCDGAEAVTRFQSNLDQLHTAIEGTPGPEGQAPPEFRATLAETESLLSAIQKVRLPPGYVLEGPVAPPQNDQETGS